MKEIHFLLEKEWLNYSYARIDRQAAESMLFHAVVKDVYCGNDALVMLFSVNSYDGAHDNNYLFKVENEQGNVVYSIAYAKKDRIRGHSFKTMESEA